MSALYLLALIAIWIGVTWLLWKGGRQFLRSGQFPVAMRITLIVIVVMAWFGWSFWEVGGKKMYWDAKVRELCAIDGGVRVYETVELPAEMFDKWGQIMIPSKNHLAEKDSYFYELNQFFIRKGTPEIYRLHIKVFRRADNKLLGDAISFARRGGDIPGPWYEDSFSCPSRTGLTDLKKQIFINDKKGGGS